jgi:hypothetical protein
LTEDTSGQDPFEGAQSAWSAVHGAVTIEQAKIGQTTNATASYEHMLDLLISALSAQRTVGYQRSSRGTGSDDISR